MVDFLIYFQTSGESLDIVIRKKFRIKYEYSKEDINIIYERNVIICIHIKLNTKQLKRNEIIFKLGFTICHRSNYTACL